MEVVDDNDYRFIGGNMAGIGMSGIYFGSTQGVDSGMPGLKKPAQEL
jgi:hypothetical protein